MPPQPEFAAFQATLTANDDQLLKDLKSAETATKKSAEAMQKSLNKVEVAGAGAGQALGGLGQAAASVGGPLGGAVGQGIAFTQMLGAMGVALTGSIALMVGLAAGVVIYREELVAAIDKGLVWLGVLEDLEAQQDRINESQDKLNRTLKTQAQQRGLEGTAGAAEARLRAAQRGAEVLERFDRLEKGRKAFEALPPDLQIPSNQRLIDGILRTNKSITDELTKQKAAKDAIAKADADTARAAEREATARMQITTARRLAAQSLLISIGAARPSEFVDDPVLRQLSALQELVGQRNRAASVTPTAGSAGTFGISQITSPLSIVRQGEVIGRQTLTLQEQSKRVAEEHRDIARETRDILDAIDRRGASARPGNTGGALVVTGRP